MQKEFLETLKNTKSLKILSFFLMETWYMYEYAELQFRNNVGVKIGETWSENQGQG